LELAQQALVVDVEADGLGGGVKVGAVNKERNLLYLCRHGNSRDVTLVMKPGSTAIDSTVPAFS